MSIAVVCPECQREAELPDELIGKKVRCNDCRALFTVKGPAKKLPGITKKSESTTKNSEGKSTFSERLDSLTKKNKKRDSDDEDRPRKKKTQDPTTMVVGAVGIVMGIVLVSYLVMKKDPPRGGPVGPAPFVVQNNPAPINPNPNPNQPNQPQPNFNPENNPQPKFNPGNNPPPNFNPGNNPPPNFNPGNNPPPMINPDRRLDEEETKALAVEWTYKPDPWDGKADLPEDGSKIKTQIFYSAAKCGPREVYFPTSPSPYFAIGKCQNQRDQMALWDIRTNKAAGVINGPTELHETNQLTVSADGKYLACRSRHSRPPTVVLMPFKENTNNPIRLDTELKDGDIEWVDFGTSSNEMIASVKQFARERMVFVWDVATRSIKKSFTSSREGERKANTLSHGRKYLAQTSRKFIWIFRLEDGVNVGVIELPKDQNNHTMDYLKICFSPDGKELAGFTDRFGQKNEIYVWDLANGQLKMKHDITGVFFGEHPHYEGPAIEYTSEGAAWLVMGNWLIEHDSGLSMAMVQSNPRFGSPEKMRLLPNDVMIHTTGDGANHRLISSKFDRKKYLDSLGQVKEEMKGLADATPADRSMVKDIEGRNEPTWSVKPDPQPTKSSLRSDTYLNGKALDIRGLSLSSGDATHAGVLSLHDIQTPVRRRALRWDRYDLANRRYLSTIELFKNFQETPNQPKALWHTMNPKGTLLAMVHPDNPKRVDVWNSDGKHLHGFLPYESPIQWLGFTTDNHLITLGNGKITLWDALHRKAIYEVNGNYQGLASLSPAANTLAAAAGTYIDLIDAKNGTITGRLSTLQPPPANNHSILMSFHPDGKMFAAVVPNQFHQQVLVWDLSAGEKLVDSFAIGWSHPSGLQWCGSKHLLQGGADLIDLELKAIVWRYASSGRFASSTPDGKHWFVFNTGGNGGAGAIVGSTLPDSMAIGTLRGIKQGAVQKILEPGNTVRIQLNFNRDANYTTNLRNGIQQRLEREQFKIGNSGTATFSVSANEESTKETMELKTMGRFEKRTISLKQVNATLSLTDSTGKVLWQEKRNFKNGGFGFRMFHGNEDPEVTLQNELWNNLSSWASSVQHPKFFYSQGGTVISLPGNSPMSMPN